MPRTDRKITIRLGHNSPEGEYTRLANTIWSVAQLSEHFVRVVQDGKADAVHLNNWYNQDGEAHWRSQPPS